jgi:hypothetical protein
MALPKYVRISNLEAQTLRDLGHVLPYVYCPANGILIDTEAVEFNQLAATVALLEIGDERRQTLANNFIAEFFMDLEMTFDAPLTVPTLQDAIVADM